MGHFALGFRALFRIWTDDAFASQVGRWLGDHPAGAAPTPAPIPAPVLQAEPLALHPRVPHPAAKAPALPAAPPTPAPAPRNEALSLLAVLQRDARLLDFLKEPLADFTDP